ncbi:rhodanese-like domain-containing protein 4, chloroplastic isoform X2 [Macadamia integrifolia]|uniref:rhodanese-like domain-containing protein 4, chloroplastic isoform X2 n=1 Tax=Macadamia integrifolia TaxID=60698 RepID=UPI001C52DC70|nr:rhodanese-like domain-containing protein 4, chloroplastic isoform X2 [Macadamia integrifolia]
MEILNAACLNTVSVLSDRRTEPGKICSLPPRSTAKFSKSVNLGCFPSKFSEVLSRNFSGSLVVLSSVFSSGLARALSYEEALEQSTGSSTSKNGSDFDVGALVDGVVSFAVENPAIIVGGATILALPLVLSQVLKKPKPWGVESAKNAYAKLAEDVEAQLLDIRSPVEFREVGSPDIRGLKKKPLSIAYNGQDKLGFLKKLSLKFKEPENTTLIILDKFDGSSELVAELVTANGFKAAYAIKDGADGTRGWLESSDTLPVTFGIAVATGLGLLAFTEIETILQVLGSAALLQLVSKKLLFAEDRRETLQQVDEFLNTKVAPKELVGDIKQIGKSLLPAPKEGSPNSEPEVEIAAADPVPQINSVPKPESVPGLRKSLSPFPSYPDFKPPTSPSPSQP